MDFDPKEKRHYIKSFWAFRCGVSATNVILVVTAHLLHYWQHFCPTCVQHSVTQKSPL